MKTPLVLIIIFIATIAISCTNKLIVPNNISNTIVIEKTYNDTKYYLPDNICIFTVQHETRNWYMSFQCDCNEYVTGDTIKYFDNGHIQYLIY